MNPQAMMTPDRIRKMDSDHIDRLMEQIKTLTNVVDQQRTDMAKLHQMIGGLEWKLEQRDFEIRSLKALTLRMESQNRTS